MKILLVEDNKLLAQTIRDHLISFYQVDIAYTGAHGAERALNPRYDVIILDLILPEKNGLDICKAVRKKSIKIPILILTAQNSIDQKVSAFDAGADDYLSKPFHFSELLARLRALTRRPPNLVIENTITIGELSIDVMHHSVKRDGHFIELRRKEFSLLEYLARHAGHVVTRSMIFDHVWETGSDTFSNTVDVHINYLRDKVDRPFKSKLIRTVPGVGYKLEL